MIPFFDLPITMSISSTRQCWGSQRQPASSKRSNSCHGTSASQILDMQGQVTRCYAETCLQKFVSDHLQRRGKLIKEFTQQKLNLRQGFVSTGMGDLQSKLLTVAEAKKRKATIESQSRGQQKLLQAENLRTVESSACLHTESSLVSTLPLLLLLLQGFFIILVFHNLSGLG